MSVLHREESHHNGASSVLSAHRYLSASPLNLAELRIPGAAQMVYFLGGGQDSVFCFGEERENVVDDYLFLLPPGLDFRVESEGAGRVDCVHIQVAGSLDLAVPAKVRVHSPEVSASIMEMAIEYARDGRVDTPLTGVLEVLRRSRSAVRVTFADHAEGRAPRDTARHSHREEHQIDYYVQAGGRFWLADQWLQIADGDLFFIPAGVEHAIELDPRAPYHNLSLKFIAGPELLDRIPARWCKAAIGAQADGMRRALQKVIVRYLLYEPITPDEVGAILDLVRRAADAPGRSRSRVEMAREIASINYSLPIRLEWVARRLGLSPAYLSRAFRRSNGETFSRYLRRIRVERAASLLRGSRLAVGDIARRCGFSSIHYFSQSFRKLTGMSPTEVRRAAPPPEEPSS